MAGEISGGHPGCAWACRAAPASVPVSGPLSAPACAPVAVSAPRWGAAVRIAGLLSGCGSPRRSCLGIDRHLHLVLHGGLDTPLFERRLVVLGEHEGGLLAGLPCDVAW